jgi:hemolysin activation/secretion protein
MLNKQDGTTGQQAPINRLELLPLLLWLGLGVGPAATAAEPLPDAGSTLQQLPPPAMPVPHKQDGVPLLAPPASVPLPAAANSRITVSGFRFTGVSRYPEAQLQQLVQDAIGHELTLAQLNDIVARITARYRQDGYLLARAYLPPQDLRPGQPVEIAIVEGRYGQIQVNNPTRLRSSVVGRALAPLPNGEVVERGALERALLLLNDTPGISARGTLAPGAQAGSTDLMVDLTPQPLASGSAELDNHGSRFTGAVRAGATLNLGNPSGYGDMLTARALTSGNGMDYGYAGWLSPALAGGSRFSVSYTDARYRLGKEFAVLDAHGDARIASVYLATPLLRSRYRNLYAQFGYDAKKFEDRIDASALVKDKSADVWSLGLSGSADDSAGSRSAFSAIYGAGKLWLDPAALALDDAGTNGRYHKFNLNLWRQQPLARSFELYALLAAQFASTNLDSSEKFQLGGASGIRAYPQGEAPGDDGYLLKLELRYALESGKSLPGRMQLLGFIESGSVRLNKNPWPALTGDNRRTLSATGVGLLWGQPNDFTISASLATKLGAARARAEGDKGARFWLQAIKYF